MTTSDTTLDDMETESDINNQSVISCLIWLDPNDSSVDARKTEEQLCTLCNHLKKFQNIDECQQYIEEQSKTDQLVIIANGRLGQELVPNIYKCQQVISIYIYCMDKTVNEEWIKKFAKVKAVVNEVDELIDRMKSNYKIQEKTDTSLAINVFSTTPGKGKSTTGVNGQFVFFQVLIDCLLRLKATEEDKKELLSLCRKEYKRKPGQLEKILDFEENYTEEKALWWYTRDSFFYKKLNEALRTQNIHRIFLFRTYIADIQRQLQTLQSQDPIRVYRSQMMSKDELETLKQHLNQFISINSFFSTSKGRNDALEFLDEPSETKTFERILFEIDADPKMATTKPFADISTISEYTDEAEILFMLGSIFRINNIYHDNEDEKDLWIIELSLCSDDEHDLRHVLTYMQQQNGNSTTNLRTLGKILWTMGNLDLAEQYFTRYLNELSENETLRRVLYEDLGKLASQKGDYDKSVQWHKKAITFKKRRRLTNGRSIYETNSMPSLLPNIPQHARWTQNANTVAGGNKEGETLSQLNCPSGLCIDENQTIFIADYENHRILQWKWNSTNGEIVAGGNGQGNRIDQLDHPTDVIFDRETDSFIICDAGNGRIVQWSRQENTKHGEVILSNIACYSLMLDDQRYLYVSDRVTHEVRRYRIGETNGILVAGGNGRGNNLNQLNFPTNIFVDKNYSVYVSDSRNHRVMKWIKGSKEGIIVAGGEQKENSVNQLVKPRGLFVDSSETVYVVDNQNHRVIRWRKDAEEGNSIVVGNGRGKEADKFMYPEGLAFDQYGHLYISDCWNHRIQRFSIEIE